MTDTEKPPVGPLTSMVVLEFGGQDRVFDLTLKWIDALQSKQGVGLGMIGYRLSSHSWHVGDITETLFYGLVGGGMPAVEARKIVNEWCDGMPLANPKDACSPFATAKAVIAAVFFGIPEDETRGKVTAAMETDGSTSRRTTGKVSRSASQSKKQQVYLSPNGLPVDLPTPK
jgi:hypothetical protein